MFTQLLFIKSKVCVHPTNSTKNNISGFILIAKDDNIVKKESSLVWIPENALETDQINALFKAESQLSSGELSHVKISKNIITNSMYVPYAVNIRICDIYSIQFREPSIGWWFGSIVINTKNSLDSIPSLFFHDDICSSTIAKMKEKNKSFDPFSSSNGGGTLYWGAIDLLEFLTTLLPLEKSTLDKTVYLVDPTIDDLRNFAPEVQERTKTITETINEARWSVLSKIAEVTSKTRNQITNLINSPAVDKTPGGQYLKQMMKNPNVTQVSDEFESARVYLAKWALGVKENAEKSSGYKLDVSYRNSLKSELGNLSDDFCISQGQVYEAMQRNHPLTLVQWNSMFDQIGRLTITPVEIKDIIFHGGVEAEVRKEVWPFLLGIYAWDSCEQERKDHYKVLEEQYAMFKSQWIGDLELQGTEHWKDQRFRIDKDVKRTDRSLQLYADETPEYDEEDIWQVTNPHLLALRNILITYNVYNENLGYVQGMNDLLSPIYYNFQDEVLAFWGFAKFMDRMERNFIRDQSGIKDQMQLLNQSMSLMLPKLFAHLEKCDSSNLFFCFRMLIVWFKREFAYEEVMRLWEVFWTDYYCSQWQIFFMLAILQKNSEIVIGTLEQFDEVLKYFNDLSGNMDVKDLLIRSELLFLQFRKIIEVLDRTRAARGEEGPGPISTEVQQLLSRQLVTKKESARSVSPQ